MVVSRIRADHFEEMHIYHTNIYIYAYMYPKV